MEKERRVKWLVIVSLIVAVLGLTIAFAALSETLTINGTATLDAAKWGIKFENLTSGTKVGDATINGSAEILEDKVTINNINVSLKTPGDSVTYKVDLVNEGSINAEISNIKVPELTEEQKRYIDFKVTYSDGKEVTKGDILNSETTKNLTIKIEFKKDITASDLPSSSEQINLSYELEFIQTDLSQGSNGDTSGDNVTGNYGNEIRSWDLSDTVKMTYYNGELQSDGTYDNGTLVISGTGVIPDIIGDEEGNIADMPVQFKLADVSSFEELILDEVNYAVLLKYNPTNLIIEEGITKIGFESFAMISTLTNVTLSSSVDEIKDWAFAACKSLLSINMSDVSIIGEYAFDQCISLKEINISKVSTIYYNAFNRCNSLRYISISNRINSIASRVFYDMANNSVIYVPDEATKNKIPADSYDSSKTTIVVDPTKFE